MTSYPSVTARGYPPPGYNGVHYSPSVRPPTFPTRYCPQQQLSHDGRSFGPPSHHRHGAPHPHSHEHPSSCGFGMLIAAASSGGKNRSQTGTNIPVTLEHARSDSSHTHVVSHQESKGILKKHATKRGKQFASLASTSQTNNTVAVMEEENKEAAKTQNESKSLENTTNAVITEKRSPSSSPLEQQRQKGREEEERMDMERPLPFSSAGPLKKRRKMNQSKQETCHAEDTDTIDDDSSVNEFTRNSTVWVGRDAADGEGHGFVEKLHHVLCMGEIRKKLTNGANFVVPRGSSENGKEAKCVNNNISLIPDTIVENDSVDSEQGHVGDSSIANAMEWLPHGKGFRVLRWDIMCKDVLPKYFSDLFPEYHHDNEGLKSDGFNDGGGDDDDDDRWIQSFRQALMMYDFEVVKNGRDFGSYRHNFFLRSKPDLCRRIVTCRENNDRNNHSPPCSYSSDLVQSGSSLDGGMEWRNARQEASSIFKLPRMMEREEYFCHSQNQHPHAISSSHSESRSHPTYLHMPMLTNTPTASFADAWYHGPDAARYYDGHISRNPSAGYIHHTRSSDMYFPSSCPPHNSILRSESKDGTIHSRSSKFIRFCDKPNGSIAIPMRSQERYESSRPTSVTSVEVSPDEVSPLPLSSMSQYREHTYDGAGKAYPHTDMITITPNPDPNPPYNIGGNAKNLKHANFPVSRRGGRRGGGVLQPIVTSRHKSA